jgi:hypothetical protein
VAYDVAICLGQQNLNKIAAAFYQRPGLRARLFRGSHATTLEGVQANVAWDVLQPPTFDLNPPSPAQWAAAIHATGASIAPSANAFVLKLPALHVTLNSGPGPATDITKAVDVICSVTLLGKSVSLTPVGAVIDLSTASPIDQLIYKQILVPNLLAQLTMLMAGQHVPHIDFRGLSFGNAALLVEGGHVIGAAFLEGRSGVPDVQSLRSAPKAEFYVMLGRDALQKVVNDGVQPLRGQTDGVNGSANFGIGSAHYSASLRFDSLNAQIRSPTSLNVQAGVTLSASAGVNVLDAILGQIAKGVTEPAKALANIASDAAKASANAAKASANAAKAAANAAENAAKAAAHAAENAAKTVAHGAESAVHTIGHALKSY